MSCRKMSVKQRYSLLTIWITLSQRNWNFIDSLYFDVTGTDQFQEVIVCSPDTEVLLIYFQSLYPNCLLYRKRGNVWNRY